MEGQENATADFHAGSAAFPQAYPRAGMFVVESGAGVVPGWGPLGPASMSTPGFGLVSQAPVSAGNRFPMPLGRGVRRTALAVYRAPGGMPVAAKGYTLFLMANEE